MFRAHVLIIRKSKLHYTASGIITRVGGRFVHETTTYRCDDTRGCVMHFWLPDDEHMCSKHVEAWKKLIVKQNFCASSWLITEINVLWHGATTPLPPPLPPKLYDVLSTFATHNILVQLHTRLEHLNSLHRIPETLTRSTYMSCCTAYTRPLFWRDSHTVRTAAEKW